MNDNTSQYAPKYYQMNPDQDTLLFDGKDLETGMLVLIGDPNQRFDPNDLNIPDDDAPIQAQPVELPGMLGMLIGGGGVPDRDYITDRLNEVNRWCEVQRVEVTQHEHGDHNDEVVTFIGRYSDGTLRKRMYNVVMPWLAKTVTVPRGQQTQQQATPEADGGFGDFRVPDDLSGA